MIQKLFTNPKVKLATVIIVGLLIFNLALSIYRLQFPSIPTIVSSSPNTNSTNINLNQNITFTFDEPVSALDLSISSEPTFSWQLSQTERNIVTATHALDFQPSTSYTINLTWGKTPLSPLTFTTIKSQTDSLLIQNMKDELARDYPLAQKLPYNTDLYRVVYSAPMVLEITIKNPAITPEKAFSEIRAWVTSVGGDANAHKYVISDKPLPSTLPQTSTRSGLKTSSPSPTPFDWDNLKDDGT